MVWTNHVKKLYINSQSVMARSIKAFHMLVMVEVIQFMIEVMVSTIQSYVVMIRLIID